MLSQVSYQEQPSYASTKKPPMKSSIVVNGDLKTSPSQGIMTPVSQQSQKSVKRDRSYQSLKG